MSKLPALKLGQDWFLGERMRFVREAFGLTQEELGDRLGVTRTQILNLERGRSEPSIRILYAVCHEFNVSADWLLGLSDTDPSWLEYEERVIRVAKVVPTLARQPDSEGRAS